MGHWRGHPLGWGHRGDGTQRDPRGGDTVMDIMGMDTMKMGTQRRQPGDGDNVGMGHKGILGMGDSVGM